jgi:hypothetical protein
VASSEVTFPTPDPDPRNAVYCENTAAGSAVEYSDERMKHNKCFCGNAPHSVCNLQPIPSTNLISHKDALSGCSKRLAGITHSHQHYRITLLSFAHAVGHGSGIAKVLYDGFLIVENATNLMYTGLAIVRLYFAGAEDARRKRVLSNAATSPTSETPAARSALELSRSRADSVRTRSH